MNIPVTRKMRQKMAMKVLDKQEEKKTLRPNYRRK